MRNVLRYVVKWMETKWNPVQQIKTKPSWHNLIESKITKCNLQLVVSIAMMANEEERQQWQQHQQEQYVVVEFGWANSNNNRLTTGNERRDKFFCDVNKFTSWMDQMKIEQFHPSEFKLYCQCHCEWGTGVRVWCIERAYNVHTTDSVSHKPHILTVNIL